MLPDDDDEDDAGASGKVNALGFLAALGDESVDEGVAGKTVLGGGMDVTMGNRMDMTLGRLDRTSESVLSQPGNKTTVGGCMDVTMAPTNLEITLPCVSRTNKTVVGGGMDITMAPTFEEHEKDSLGDFTTHGGGMEATLASKEASHLPDSLPNSNNSSFDGGATATVKFSQLALANNTLVLPRRESEEDEEEDFTRAPEQVFSYDPSQVISSTAPPPKAQPLARASSILKKSNIESDGPTPSNIEDEETSMRDKTILGEDMEMTTAFCENIRAETELSEEVLRDEVAGAPVEQPKVEQRRSGIVTTNEEEDIAQGDLHTQGQTSQRGRSPEKTRPCNKTSIQDEDMEMTRAGVKNQVDSTRLTQDNMDLTKMVPFNRQGPTSVEQDEMEMTKAGSRNNGNRTTMIQDNMEMTKVGGGPIENRTSNTYDAMEMTRTNSDRLGQGHSRPQEHDMEMTRAGAKSKVDRTAMTQDNMEITRVPPKLIVTNHQDDIEMTRAQMEGVVDVSPSVPSTQDDAGVVQGEESGWETMHSPVISVSPILTDLPVKTKTQGDLLRENFPSPAASPSPEMTRMLGGMPVKPKTKAGIWDGDVTSFMPVGESTRALKFRVPPPSTFSPNCSPLAKASHTAGEVGDLTSFAPGEEYESTRKLPTRPAPVKPLRQELPSPLASTALKEVGDLTTFSPMEEYESTRKLPKAPTLLRSACVSTVDEEVTSPNRGARVQETMLPGLEVTAAPGCYCFASQRGAAQEEEKRVECPLHVTIAPRNEDKQMGISLAKVSVSPPTKRLSEDFEEEQAKRQCRQEAQERTDEREEGIIRSNDLDQDREETEKDA